VLSEQTELDQNWLVQTSLEGLHFESVTELDFTGSLPYKNEQKTKNKEK
jgi:hypothetical protein